MTYEYDPIPRPHPVCSTNIEFKLEKELSSESFQDLGLSHFLQNPLFISGSGSLSSSFSRREKGKKNSGTGLHPLPSSCQDVSEASSDEEEEEKDLSRKTEITTTKRSAWPLTMTKRSRRPPEFEAKAQNQLAPLSCLANFSCEGVTTKDCQGRRADMGRGKMMRRKRLPRLTPRASHLLQVLSLLCLGSEIFF